MIFYLIFLPVDYGMITLFNVKKSLVYGQVLILGAFYKSYLSTPRLKFQKKRGQER